jgi:hypothetical protein
MPLSKRNKYIRPSFKKSVKVEEKNLFKKEL